MLDRRPRAAWQAHTTEIAMRYALLAIALLGAVGAAEAQSPSVETVRGPPLPVGGGAEVTAHAFTFPALMGGAVRLADHRGKAVLVVNTASECGFVGQLGGLQGLYEARAKDGLVVIGVPSNDFGGQEPRDGQSIATFCKLNYGVTFPMTSKQAVKGPGAHAFYRWARTAFGAEGEPSWNFHKLLIGPDGRAVAAFPASTTPNAPELKAAIDRALASRPR